MIGPDLPVFLSLRDDGYRQRLHPGRLLLFNEAREDQTKHWCAIRTGEGETITKGFLRSRKVQLLDLLIGRQVQSAGFVPMRLMT